MIIMTILDLMINTKVIASVWMCSIMMTVKQTWHHKMQNGTLQVQDPQTFGCSRGLFGARPKKIAFGGFFDVPVLRG